MFKIEEKDNELIRYAKNEFNILYKENYSEEDYIKANSIILLLYIYVEENNKNYIKENYIKLLYKKPLSPIILNNEEDYIKDKNGDKYNKRLNILYKEKSNKYYISEPYICNILKTIYECKTEEKVNKKEFARLYLSAGGVITGNYIGKCYLTKSVVESNIFAFQSTIKIDCSKLILEDGTKIIYTDHRNKKLTALKSFYNVDICVDNKIKDKHIDVRKFKPINL